MRREYAAETRSSAAFRTSAARPLAPRSSFTKQPVVSAYDGSVAALGIVSAPGHAVAAAGVAETAVAPITAQEHMRPTSTRRLRRCEPARNRGATRAKVASMMHHLRGIERRDWSRAMHRRRERRPTP